MKGTQKGLSPAQIELEVIRRVTEVLPNAVHSAMESALGIDFNPTPVGNRATRNGVKEPRPGGKCHSVWDELDKAVLSTSEVPSLPTFLQEAQSKGINPNNARIEFYNWRRFYGLTSAARVRARTKALMRQKGASAGQAMARGK